MISCSQRDFVAVQESAKYLAASPYIRNLAMLVIAYGMSINIVEASMSIFTLLARW